MEKALRKHYKRTSKNKQDDLLDVTKTQIKTPVMVTNYNPMNPNIKGIIHRNWNIISNSLDKPLIGFRRLPNLREYLTNATTSYPPLIVEKSTPHAAICTRLGKCTSCPLIKRLDSVKCYFTNKSFKTQDLPKHVTCELSNVIYLITCTKCHMQHR